MLLALALLTQTAPDTTTYNLATACSRAAFLVGEQQHANPLDTLSYQGSYLLLAAEADPQGKPVMKRFVEITKAEPANLSPDEARTTILQCDTRFPMVRKAEVTLPRDPFERDMICFTATMLMHGVAQQASAVTGDTAEPLRWDRMSRIFGNRLTDEALADHGIRGEQAMDAQVEKETLAALHLGNFHAISIACEKSPTG